MTRLKIHMVGVGGISMRGLASYFQEQGHTVTGCDVANVKVAGLSVRHGHNSSHITADVNQVIINAAITPSSTGWSEVLTAEKLGIPVIKRAAAIGEITRAANGGRFGNTANRRQRYDCHDYARGRAGSIRDG